MTIPNISPIREFLSTLSTEKGDHAQGWQSMELLGAIGAMHSDGRKERLPARSLFFKSINGFDLGSCIKRIQVELKKSHHPSRPEVVLTILRLLTGLRPEDSNAVECLNAILDNAIGTEVHEYVMLPVAAPPGYRVSVGRFTLGPLDAAKLEYRCKRAGSDYFALWGGGLRGAFTIERAVHSAVVIDWTTWFKRWRPRAEVGPFLNDYFDAVSAEMREGFWEGLRSDQELLMAADVPFADPKALIQIPYQMLVTVFLNIGETRGGWVCPSNHGSTVILDLGKTDVHITAFLKLLKDSYRFPPEIPNEIASTISTFARFLARAREHELDGRFDEAFLHHIIALDLLFGDKAAASKSVARRTAAALHPKKAYDALKAEIEDLYNARSLYVHRGQSAPPPAVAGAKVVTKEILFTLLRLQKQPNASYKDAWNNWISTLDYFASALESGRTIPEDELVANGMIDQTV